MSPYVRQRITLAVAALAAVALGGAAPAAASDHSHTPKPPVSVQLLSFNDYHGHIEPDVGADSTVTVNGAPVVTNGAAYLATHLAQLRTGHKNSLTVAAGDLIGGSTFTSGFFHDEPSVETLNAMKLDVSSVGNHEFDEGVTELLRMQKGGCHPVDGCFQQNAKGKDIRYPGADFRWLAANVVNQKTGRTVLPGTWVKKVGDAKIGFIGMTLEGTDSLVAPSGIVGWDFQDEVDAGNRAARKLKHEGVQAIVVLLHEGGLQTGTYDGCTGISGPIVDIATRLDPSIDALITGHTHAAYNCTINDPSGQPRKVVSALSYGRLITEMNFNLDPKTKDVVRSSVVAVNHLVTRDVPKDPTVDAIVQKWTAKANVDGNVQVGTVSENITRAFLPPPSTADDRASESSLSNLIADAQLAATDGATDGAAQIAFMNAGGVRSDLLYTSSALGEGDGVVTYREAFNVQPFSNILQSFDMTGAQIEAVLEQQWVTGRPGGRPVLRLGISNGFSYSWSASAPFGDKIDPASITLNGTVLDPAGTYRVAASNFLADGGDSYLAFRNGTPRTGGLVDLDALVAYLGANSPVSAPPAARSVAIP
ncbi:bifunctional metallophosphatase/5'-nucleotidase [Pengzhenrongella phosphoraccumulans]|uniref:bifunctional metallophosphatase/5'-nucleotidase n=1 Tax=Pengzhenrongella phosphoraccumulans TaxID=3114394 RepID=UPI00388D8BC4